MGVAVDLPEPAGRLHEEKHGRVVLYDVCTISCAWVRACSLQ